MIFQDGDKVKVTLLSGHVIETIIIVEDVEPYVMIPALGYQARLSLVEFPEVLVEKIEPSQREKLNNTESIS